MSYYNPLQAIETNFVVFYILEKPIMLNLSKQQREILRKMLKVRRCFHCSKYLFENLYTVLSTFNFMKTFFEAHVWCRY